MSLRSLFTTTTLSATAEEGRGTSAAGTRRVPANPQNRTSTIPLGIMLDILTKAIHERAREGYEEYQDRNSVWVEAEQIATTGTRR
jgi:hypothetical protein